MKRALLLPLILILVFGLANVSLAQGDENNESDFPVALYLDFSGRVVSIDEVAGTFTLDNGIQVIMDLTKLPPGTTVAVGDFVTVSGALQDDGTLLADIIVTGEAIPDGQTEPTRGVIYGPGGSACDQAENCQLVDDPGNAGTVVLPTGVDTIVIKAGQTYVEIPIPTDGSQVCVEGYCVSSVGGSLTFSTEDGAKDISHIQLWAVGDSDDDEDNADNEDGDEAEDGDEVEAADCTVTDDASTETDDTNTSARCHPVLLIFSEAFATPYAELEALFRDGKFGIGEIGRAYLLADAAGVDVAEIIALRDSGMGWGNIMKEYPDVHPSELAPGSVIGNGRGKSVRDANAPGNSGNNGNGRGNSGNAPGNSGNNGNGRGNSGNAPGNSGNNGGGGNGGGGNNGNGNGRGNNK